MEQITCPGCSHQLATDRTIGWSGNQEATCPECRTAYPLALWRLDTASDDPLELETLGDAVGTAAPPDPIETPPPVPVQQPAQQRQPTPGVWRCPYCRSAGGYDYRSEVTTAGWIFAIVLFLFMCLPLFWIGFLIRRNVPYCRACKMDLR